MFFETLYDLQNNEGKTITMAEQNARKGLEFADIGYVLESGDAVLENPEVARLFLGDYNYQ